MASNNIEYDGAIGGADMNQPHEENDSYLDDIIDINNLDQKDDDNW